MGMSNTKTMPAAPRNGELISLLHQLNEQKTQIERLLGRVEHVLRGTHFSRKARRGEFVAPLVPQARRSPLDRMKAVMEFTSDLREENGNLSAARVAKVFGLSLGQLAGWLGRTKQAVSKTPDADSLQEALGYFERVARLRIITNGDANFRKWLRTSHELLDNAAPLELLAKREWQALADFVEDILTGNPG
jgi:antitoxin Xre/MbcA/ParS-like protein